MKTTKTIAKIAGAVLAGMMALAFASCNEKNSGSGEASADGLTKAQAKLLKGKPAPEADFEIKLSDDGNYVTITAYKGKAEEVVIPSTIQGLPVKALEGYFADGKKLTGVVIPEGVEYLLQTFSSADNLTTVVLPSTLKAIGRDTFRGCVKLTDVNLPEGLVAIGRGAFRGSGITSISLPKSLKMLGNESFINCNNLSEITIPEGLSVAGGSANFSFISSSYINGSVVLWAGRGAYEPEHDFTYFFSGEKIKESVALQKLLKDTKTVELTKSEIEKLHGKPYTEWNW